MAYTLHPRIQLALGLLRTVLDDLGNDCPRGELFGITFENLAHDEFENVSIDDLMELRPEPKPVLPSTVGNELNRAEPEDPSTWLMNYSDFS